MVMVRPGWAAAVMAAVAWCAASAWAGRPWPQPAKVDYLPNTLVASAPDFAFNVVGHDSDILQRAIIRYASLLFVPVPPVEPLTIAPAGVLTGVDINVLTPSTALGLDTDESYVLVVPPTSGSATLTAATVFGAMHGLERLSQLMDWYGLTNYIVLAQTVNDTARFPYRGAMLDTARHYLPLPSILAFIDAMTYNFLSVLHWHIVDDQSFPFVSSTFPNLSIAGAYNSPATTHTYPPEQVQAVIAYALDRGVRVVVEFDTPGHTTSWGLGQPGLLTQCYNGPNPLPGQFGPINPTLNTTWAFLQAFFTEVSQVFPDDYLFMGGDEVGFSCWASNPQVQQWMAAQGYGTNYTLLESYYEQKLLDMISGLNKSYVVWQEIFDNGLTIPSQTVINAWKGGSTAAGLAEIQRITAAGYRAVLSAGWYLNYIDYGAMWQTYYTADPQNFTGTPAQKALVMGGEFCLWAEFIDSSQVIARGWPFGGAIAERLWSPATVTDLNDAADRLHVHNCRMKSRGLPVEPANGPSYCPFEYVMPYNPPFPTTVHLSPRTA